MTRPDFFPDIAFGWAFYGVLMSLLIMASVIDFRGFTIPKKLSIACLVLGIVFNLGRGLWLGLQGKEVWKLSSGPVLGALDGFLFSAAGFLFAFAIFFGLWFLKACGGGDVKLYAAAGAWLGPWYFLFVLLVSVLVHMLVASVWILGSMLTSGFAQANKRFSHEESRKFSKGGYRPKHRGMTYSFPLAVATAVILLLVLSADLGLVEKSTASSGQPVSQLR